MNQYLEVSQEDENQIQEGVSLILNGLGLLDEKYAKEVSMTPERLSRALRELCAGMQADIDRDVFEHGIFETEQGELRMPTKFTNISARGLCPHHLLPILYRADVEYKPRKLVVGLSRVHRLVRVLSARPVLQEQLAYDIANELRKRLSCPVSVRLTGLHMCMVARGSKSEIDSPVISEIELD